MDRFKNNPWVRAVLAGLLCVACYSSSAHAANHDTLLAQNKRRQSAPRATGAPRYQSVNPDGDEEKSSSPFKGQPIPQTNQLFFGLGMNYFDGFGLQGRYAARLLDNVIPDLNNSLYIEGGIGMTFYGKVSGTDGVTGFHFIVTGRWDFQVNHDWTLFGNLGFGYNAVSSGKKAGVSGGGFFPAGGVGAMYALNQDWALRADLSYQFLGGGITYRF